MPLWYARGDSYAGWRRGWSVLIAIVPSAAEQTRVRNVFKRGGVGDVTSLLVPRSVCDAATPLGGSSSSSSGGCDDGHWVQEVAGDGAIVILEDGSKWLIDSVGQIDTALWLTTEEVVICGSQLINTDTGDKVSGRRL